MAAHSRSVSSYRMIRGPRLGVESCPNRCLQPTKPDYHCVIVSFRPALAVPTHKQCQPSLPSALCRHGCSSSPAKSAAQRATTASKASTRKTHEVESDAWVWGGVLLEIRIDTAWCDLNAGISDRLAGGRREPRETSR